MTHPVPWIQRLLASTRGEIIVLLRRAPRTVHDLAAALGLTDNAIRTHLASLERDGLVEQLAPLRRGVGKPAHRFSLTPAADELLARAYAPVLHHLLGVLDDEVGPGRVEALLREAGRRAAAEAPPADGDLRSRAEAAVRLLAGLGGVADVEEREDGVTIRGYACPLASLVPEHPAVCRLAEALVQEVVGAPVRERCEKGERPRCRFEIEAHPPG